MDCTDFDKLLCVEHRQPLMHCDDGIQPRIEEAFSDVQQAWVCHVYGCEAMIVECLRPTVHAQDFYFGRIIIPNSFLILSRGAVVRAEFWHCFHEAAGSVVSMYDEWQQ